MFSIFLPDSSGSIENSLPIGAISSYAGMTVPFGWLLCNGIAISRVTYPYLFAVIGTSWGYGDNSTTFNLPDLRGRFLRSVDTGIGMDPDRASRTASNTGGNTGDNVGSVQGYEWKSFWMMDTVQNGVGAHFDIYMGKSTTAYTGNLFCGYWSNASAGIGTKWHTEEVRPVNVNVAYMIKYY